MDVAKQPFLDFAYEKRLTLSYSGTLQCSFLEVGVKTTINRCRCAASILNALFYDYACIVRRVNHTLQIILVLFKMNTHSLSCLLH